MTKATDTTDVGEGERSGELENLESVYKTKAARELEAAFRRLDALEGLKPGSFNPDEGLGEFRDS